MEGAFREKGKSYVRWAANMAVGLQTGVPWVMCKQDDAPDPVVSLISLICICVVLHCIISLKHTDLTEIKKATYGKLDG